MTSPPGNDEEGILREYLSGSILILFGNAVGMGGSFAARILAGRSLGPTEYGVLVLSLTIMNVVGVICLLGLPSGIARHLPRISNQSSIVKSSIIVVIVGSTLCAVFILMFRDIFFNHIISIEYAPIFILFIIFIPIRALNEVSIGALRGFSDAKGRVIVSNIVNQFGVVIGVGIATIFGLGIYGIASSWLIALVASTVLGLGFIVWNLSSTDIESGERNSLRINSLVWFSLPLMLSSAIWILLNNMDNFFMSYFLSETSVGIYDASFTMSKSFSVITAAFAFLFLPQFSDLHSKEEHTKMINFYKVITKWMTISSIPLALVLIFYSTELLHITYGRSYSEGGIVLTILTVGFLSHVLTAPNGNGLIAIGKTDQVLYGNLIALCANFILNIFLIPKYGITGGAIASAITFIASNAYISTVLFLKAGILPIFKGQFIILLASLSTFLISRNIIQRLSLATYVEAILSVFATISVIIIILPIVGFYDEEKVVFRLISENII